MNQARYTIQLDNEMDSKLLMVTIDCNIKRMQHQLHDEARKKKKFFGLFYTPTPGGGAHAAAVPFRA